VSGECCGRNIAGLAYERIGEADEMLGKIAGAVEVYKKALSIFQAQTEIDPTNALYRTKFAEGLSHLGSAQAGREVGGKRHDRVAHADRRDEGSA
jgi:hypothetical protein